jgi:hypothetical protein
VRRLPALLLLFFFLNSFSVPAQQQISDEEKKRLFLKAREEMKTLPYSPPPVAVPKPKPKPTPAPIETTPPQPVTEEPPVKPIVKPPPVTIPKPTPEPVKKPTPVIQESPKTNANIVVRESGVGKADDDNDKPAPKEEGFWSRLFGGGSANYKYLSPAVRRAIDRASVTRGRWRYIVVHNSGTRQGNARAFEHYHRNVRRMPNGMAYHFVIGNGSSSKRGEIEIGKRWSRQIQGGHVHSDYLNNIAIGICLVGDFNNDSPRKEQLEALEEIIKYLRRRVGRVQGQQAAVRAHKEINPPRWPTDCPGDEFPYGWLHRNF